MPVPRTYTELFDKVSKTSGKLLVSFSVWLLVILLSLSFHSDSPLSLPQPPYNLPLNNNNDDKIDDIHSLVSFIWDII